ncbi:aspartate aminotransferase family protein [candidate division KSB1 bacterium]
MDFKDLSFSDAPNIKTSPPGPISKEYLTYQSANEGNAVSYPKGMPMALKRAKGATVEDVDGNIYIDFFGGAGVINIGHGNPEVLKVAHEQIDELTHCLDFSNPGKKTMVETLLQILPDEIDRVFFGAPTGSDAVESAIKLAKYNTKKVPVIAFEGSYHGMTAYALSLCSGDAFKEDFLPLMPEIHFAPYSYCYRCPFKKERDKCEIECAQYFEHIIEDPHSGVSHPAAIIVEPIQGEGGSIVPHEGFIPKLREICDKYNVLMIHDEIQAGFCRTGKMFSFEHTKTVPDIITLSKALGGIGFPISAIAYKKKLDTWPPGKHIGTFRGNVVAYSCGAAGISFMLKTDLAEHSLELGEKILSWLKEIEADSRFIGEVRGKGLMLGVEFVKDKETKEPFQEIAAEVRTACHQRGLCIEIGGHYFNVARFLPPLVITEELAKKGIEVFADAVKSVESKK